MPHGARGELVLTDTARHPHLASPHCVVSAAHRLSLRVITADPSEARPSPYRPTHSTVADAAAAAAAGTKGTQQGPSMMQNQVAFKFYTPLRRRRRRR